MPELERQGRKSGSEKGKKRELWVVLPFSLGASENPESPETIDPRNPFAFGSFCLKTPKPETRDPLNCGVFLWVLVRKKVV